MSTDQNKISEVANSHHNIEHKNFSQYDENENLMQGLQRINKNGELEEYSEGYWHLTDKGMK